MAAKKQFELEQVLNYRREMERLRKQEFAESKKAFEQASDLLQQEEQQLADVSTDFCIRQKELKNIEDMRMYADFFVRKREEIKDHKERIEVLDRVMSDRREYLLEASKDKKVLESLKEKKAREFRLLMDQKEQAFMDEISVQKKGNEEL